ncbi:vWA domain-containing protein [Paenisporosarcina cavernae]|uniref:VWA domain-containing protein n=1 Tax=Paenisporosarcina cavernae TaxID=2320858 RepID=A0A385YR76_9BACL|nr:BatA and WFA domain-containing protein [Paenisporosarcina cavernae]AYC29086.1 VWA domain-containing protein [Paenisporosarcina cavernae]
MIFGNFAALAALVFPLTVLLYYFFRKKYVPFVTSSTMFWQTNRQETKVSPFLQNLQRNLLFYLQIIALLLFVFVLLQPAIKKKEIAGEQVVWVVDTSATMLAELDGQTLLDRSKEEMAREVKLLGDKPLTIITTGKEPTIVLQNETNSSKMEQTIESISASYGNESWETTLNVATNLVATKQASIYVFTDSLDRDLLPARENIEWHVQANTKQLANVSLDKFVASTKNDQITAVAKIVNDSDEEVSGNFLLRNGENDQILLRESFTIAPHDAAQVVVETPKQVAVLEGVVDVKDDYPVDNQMTTILEASTSEIVVDADLHTLLTKGLEAIGKYPISKTKDSLYTNAEKQVIMTNDEGMLQQSSLPGVLIGRTDQERIEVEGEIETTNSSLFAFADFSDVYVASIYPSFEGFNTLATIDGHPFIQQSPRGDVIVLTDIDQTDWALHPSFPLFLWNMTNELSLANQSLGIFQPNEKRSVSIEKQSSDLELFTWGNELLATIPEGSAFQAPAKPGVYRVVTANDEKTFTVLLPASEKTITTGRTFVQGSVKESTKAVTTSNSFLMAIVLLLVLLMALEWEVQRRRGFTT